MGSSDRLAPALVKDYSLKLGDPNFAHDSLMTSLRQARGYEEFSERFRTRHKQNVDNLGQQRQRLAVTAGAGAQAKFRDPGGASFADKLEQTIRRGRARQGIVNRGDKAIANQQLKDRLQLARAGMTRQGQLMGASASAARLQKGLDITKEQAASSVSQANAGMYGFLAGSALSAFDFGGNETEIPIQEDPSIPQGGFSEILSQPGGYYAP